MSLLFVWKAGNILYTNSGRDTTVTGAHLEADRVWMDVGRDLTVASLQDHYDSRNFNWNAGVDVTIGYGVSVSGSLGMGGGKSNSDWVGQQTSIVGRDEVDIYVDRATLLNGGIIATNKGGDLTLNTDSLAYNSIKDTDKGYQWGFQISGGFNTGGGFAEGTGPFGEATQNLQGESSLSDKLPTIGFQYSAHDKRGIVRPTVTEGEIIVRANPDAATDGSLAGLNRDIDRSREITKDEKINVDVYVNPAAVAEIVDGFPTIVGQVAALSKELKGLLSSLDSAIEQLPDDVQAAGKTMAEHMKANGVPEEAIKSLLSNPEYMEYLYTLSDFEHQFAVAQQKGELESFKKNETVYNPVTGKYEVQISHGANTPGEFIFDKLAGLSNFIDTLGTEEQRTAALIGMQVVLGGVAATVTSYAKSTLIDAVAGDVIKKVDDFFAYNTYTYLTVGKSYEDYVESETQYGLLTPEAVEAYVAENSRPVKLLYAVVLGMGGGIKSFVKGKGAVSSSHMLGSGGVQVTSKTLWKGKDSGGRIDVENPAPGVRPGQIHYQEAGSNIKYQFDPSTNSFLGAPSYVNNLLKTDSRFKAAIEKGLKFYLGER